MGSLVDSSRTREIEVPSVGGAVVATPIIGVGIGMPSDFIEGGASAVPQGAVWNPVTGQVEPKTK